MKTLLKLEEVFLFGLGLLLFAQLDYAWWWFALLILAPDLSMLGYAAGARVGAIAYNFAHHRGMGIGLYLLGAYSSNQPLQLAGVVLFAHSSMDRVFGYGLKL
ncbi:MAG: DUF4260 domain-containing protein [Anaerolineae bacterium]|nr:DUF4260 domain-containing protein [Anaerolineae bacterium]